ncbi:hypothetical protein PJI17_32610, partial [Mycobacterium kansasii]
STSEKLINWSLDFVSSPTRLVERHPRPVEALQIFNPLHYLSPELRRKTPSTLAGFLASN